MKNSVYLNQLSNTHAIYNGKYSTMKKKLKVAFINPPHADWSLANNMTYLMMQSHYNHYGKYPDQVEWLPAPYKFNKYQTVKEIYNEIPNADVYLFSSYAWNYDICDDLATYIKEVHPTAHRIVGGPHIGTHDKSFLDTRTMYDFICQPTKPGEVFMEDFINCYIDNNGTVEPADVSWELRSLIQRRCEMPDYSIYEEHFDYIKETCTHAYQNKLEPFIVIETTRGCPYKCVYCEWGGGIDTKILKKDLDIVKRDILSIKNAGFRDAYLTDANFGAFEERDLEIFAFAWENNFNLTDISTMKSKDLTRRKRLVDKWFEIVGKGFETHSPSQGGTDMWGETEHISIVPTVSIQSISDEAMAVSKRVDLDTEDKLELTRHIEKRCREEGFPVPALELILAMPGSTLEDFYRELDIIWSFKAWGSFRHDYMFLPDSTLSDPEYKNQYDIQTVDVYSDLADEAGIDNWGSLYKAKRNEFKTIASCYSFTREDMIEMWIMNHAGNKLLQDIYPKFEGQISPADFGKQCYKTFKQLPGFNEIYNYVDDLYNPNTPMKSIKRINDQQRTEVINTFIDNAAPAIYSEMFIHTESEPKRNVEWQL